MDLFESDRSDLAIPIAGFIIIGIIGLFVTFNSILLQFDLISTTGLMQEDVNQTAFLVIGIIGMFVGAYALRKALLIEGMTFFVMSSGSIWHYITNYNHSPVFIVLVIILVMIAFMSYRVGALDLVIINGLFALATLCSVFIDGIPIIAGILTLIIAAVSFYVALNDWMFVQDIMSACDDGCDCEDECCCENNE